MTVRLPCEMQDASTVVIEPLHSSLVILGSAALFAICVPIADVCRVAVMYNSDMQIKILAGFHAVSVNSVCPVSK